MIPWLTILWAIPVIGAALIIVLPASLRQFAKYAGVVVSLAVLALALMLAVRFDPSGQQFQFVENHPWIPSFGTGYILGLDGIALALVVLTAVLVPILLIAGWNDADDRPGLSGRASHSYIALTLAVEGMVMMSLVALDILLFYVFFEAMLIPMYFLIGGFGGGRAGSAGESPGCCRSGPRGHRAASTTDCCRGLARARRCERCSRGAKGARAGAEGRCRRGCRAGSDRGRRKESPDREA